MSKHLIAARLGPHDDFTIAPAAGEQLTEIQFLVTGSRLEFGISPVLRQLADLGLQPSIAALDLSILAAHVQAADTRINRLTESEDGWTRQIRLLVPVHDTDLWELTKPLLDGMLRFLTGDLWTVEFRKLATSHPAQFLPKPGNPGPRRFTALALLSGGLDSLIGAIDALETDEYPLFISHAGDASSSAAQNKVEMMLASHYGEASFERLRLAQHFRSDLIAGKELTTRSRSFLFFALGALAGSSFETPFTLRVPENGLIAINAPLDPLRLGALSTRTTHPYYIARWNELLTVLGVPGHLENPYWDKTKGEMASGCHNREVLGAITPETLSCSSPAARRWQGQRAGHCGYCLPCIIRRAALLAAFGSNADTTVYARPDLTVTVLNTRTKPGQLVRSLQYALAELDANPNLARLNIYKPGPLSDVSNEDIARLESVYHRGMNEVSAFLAGVRTRAL